MSLAILCFTSPGFAVGQTTTTTTTKPAQSTATSNTTEKHSTKRVSGHTTSSKTKSGRKKVVKKRGQQAIDSERARQIQTALIREHYMQGAPSGTWDAATQAAMQKYQAAQGWQSKTTPDARALIKLGLGPNNDHLLNPESAMTTSAPAANETKTPPKPTASDSNVPNQ
jgi:hypothetical protein